MHVLPVYLHTPIFPGIAPILPHHGLPFLSPCPKRAGASEPTLQHSGAGIHGEVFPGRVEHKAAAPAVSASRVRQKAEAAERCAFHLSSVQLLLFKVLLCPLQNIGKLCQTNPARYPPHLDWGKQYKPLIS